MLSQGRFEEAKEEARIWLDHKMAKKVINTQNPTFSLDENSFDAVGMLKAETDKCDPFYIYRINNGRLNGGTDYVFKSSREMALIAIKMDVNNEEETGLQNENAYFDVTHCQVFGFKSFALWLVHSSMREMIHLASVEMHTENAEDIVLFFNHKYKFNPRCFLCDEAGANYKAIK